MTEEKFKPNQVVWAQDHKTEAIYPGVVIDPNNELVKSGALGEARKGYKFLLWLGLKEAYLTREDRLKDFCSEFAECYPKIVQDNSAAKDACKTLVKMAMSRGKVDVKSVPDWEAWATENAHSYSPLSLTSIFYNSMARNCKPRKPESVGIESPPPEVETEPTVESDEKPPSPAQSSPSSSIKEADQKPLSPSSDSSSSPARSEGKSRDKSRSPESEAKKESPPFSTGAVVWAKDEKMSHYWPSMFAGRTEECPSGSWTVVVTKKQPHRIYIPEKNILEFGTNYQRIFEASINNVDDKSYKMAIRGVVMFIAKKKNIQIPEDMNWKTWARKNVTEISNFVADPEELSRLLKASESTMRPMPAPKKEPAQTSFVSETKISSTVADSPKAENGDTKPTGTGSNEDKNGEKRTPSTEPPSDPAPAPKKRKFKSAKQIEAEKEAKRLKKLGIEPPPPPVVPEPEPEPVRAPSPKGSSDDDMDTAGGSGGMGDDDLEMSEEAIKRAWKKRMKKQKKMEKLRRIQEMEEEARRAKIERKRARKLEKMRQRAIAEGRIPSDKPSKPKKVSLDADGNPIAKRPTLGVRKKRGDTFNEDELDLLRIPLDQGWVRELVQRKTDGPKFGDVYYKPPKGKKLRSMPDIQKFLEATGSELKLEYFSFADIKCHLEGEIFIPA